MLPVINPIIKVMIVMLAGSIVVSPSSTVRTPNHPKPKPPIVEKQPTPKKKLPIIAGYKKDKNPLPQGRTAKDNYKEAWSLLKKELGW
jgi:hypothetical protein